MPEPQVQDPTVEPEPTPVPEPEPTVEPVAQPEPKPGGEGEPKEPGKESASFKPSLEEIEKILREDSQEEDGEPAPAPYVPPPVASQVQPQERTTPQQEPARMPQIPAEVMAIKPQDFMAQGQVFDDIDANTYGTPSWEARRMSELAQNQKMTELGIQQRESERQRGESQTSYNKFVQTHPDMRNNPVNQQAFNEFMMTGGAVDGVMPSMEELWAMRQFIKNAYRPAKARGGNGNPPRKTTPAAVTSIPRATEPQGPGDAQNWGDGKFGPE